MTFITKLGATTPASSPGWVPPPPASSPGWVPPGQAASPHTVPPRLASLPNQVPPRGVSSPHWGPPGWGHGVTLDTDTAGGIAAVTVPHHPDVTVTARTPTTALEPSPCQLGTDLGTHVPRCHPLLVSSGHSVTWLWCHPARGPYGDVVTNLQCHPLLVSPGCGVTRPRCPYSDIVTRLQRHPPRGVTWLCCHTHDITWLWCHLPRCHHGDSVTNLHCPPPRGVTCLQCHLPTVPPSRGAPWPRSVTSSWRHPSCHPLVSLGVSPAPPNHRGAPHFALTPRPQFFGGGHTNPRPPVPRCPHRCPHRCPQPGGAGIAL
ncbi:uncharacterized protein [Phaenicophaeus curvirostris]|uniref:uncharacterized protein n=1 Tax=Phaenicophaeus curvirostris TaxID=33595 RepID=UPI0037F099E0